MVLPVIGKSRHELLAELRERADANPRYRHWPERVNGPLLGFVSGSGPVFFRFGTHRLILGGSGSGKGTSVIIPMALHDDGHALFVVDPNNGAIPSLTAGYRQTLGPVHVIDPYGATNLFPAGQSDRFNPLDALDARSATVVEDAAAIARALCYSPDDQGGGDSAYFDRSARSLVTFCLLYLITRRGEDRSLQRLRDLTSMLPDEFDKIVLGPALNSKALGGTLRRYAEEIIRHSEKNERGYESILSTIRSYTFWNEFMALRPVTVESTFDYAAVREQGGTVYIVVPDQRLEESSAWLRVMMQAARIGFQNAPSPRPVHFVIDEAAAFGRFDLIPNALRSWRASGLHLHLCYQNYSQILSIWDKGAGAIMDVEVIQFLGSQDWETLELISKLIGEQDMIVPTAGMSDGWSVSTAQGESRGTSATVTKGTSTSTSESATQTFGTSRSETVGMSHSVSASWSETEGTGTSSSSSRPPGSLFATSTSEGSSTSTSTTRGGSTTHGTSQSTSVGQSESTATGTTRGTSTSDSAANGTTHSTSSTDTNGRNTGTSESFTLQLRRRLRPDELRCLPGSQMVILAAGVMPEVIYKEHFFRNLRMVERAALHFAPSW